MHISPTQLLPQCTLQRHQLQGLSPLLHCELRQLSGESSQSPTPSPQLAGGVPPRSLDNFQQGQIRDRPKLPFYTTHMLQ